MLKIDLGSDVSSYVLVHLFKDAMAKIGRSKKSIVSMHYDAVNGLSVVNEDGIEWTLEVNAKISFPKSLKKNIVEDKKAKCFCTECTVGISDESGLCSICEYLKNT